MGEAANEKKLRSVSHKSQTVSEPVSQLTYTLFTELKKQIRKCGGAEGITLARVHSKGML